MSRLPAREKHEGQHCQRPEMWQNGPSVNAVDSPIDGTVNLAFDTLSATAVCWELQGGMV